MTRNLISLFGIVIVLMLGLATYHLNSVRALPDLPIPFSHWEDTGGLTTIQDAMQTGRFKTTPKGRINFGYTESVHWFRFQLQADSLPRELAFEIRNHTIDYLELLEVKAGVITSLGKTGSRLPFAQRPSPTKTFAYLLSIEAGQPIDYYLRIDKRYENLATELTIWHTDDFEDKEQREYFLWGFFLGVVGLIVLLAFLFFAATRDPVYGYYGLFILALALRQFADTGLGFQYLWPQLPAINQPDPLIQSLWIYLPAMLLFQQYFLELRRESKPVFWVTQVLKYVFIGLFISLVICQLTGFSETYTGANRLIRQIHTMMANTVFLTFMACVVVGLRANDSVKRFYGTGFGIQTVCQLFVTVTANLRKNNVGSN